MSAEGAFLYHGVVSHRRLKPVGHRLAYRVFSMLIDLDRIDETASALGLFSRNRFNLFSFHDRDFAGEGDAPIAERVRTTLRKAGFAADGRISLLCYPRILGYAFNPLAVYYCRDARDRLEAIVYEVRNTFGGKHSYIVAVDSEAPVIRHAADKVFHVSPFMEMAQRYNFRLTRPAESLAIAIRQTDAEGPILDASFTGVREEMTDRALLRAFFRYPLMTVKVIAAIHVEAAKLFMKGLRTRQAAREPDGPYSVVAPRQPREAA
jgi:hypothetical protein